MLVLTRKDGQCVNIDRWSRKYKASIHRDDIKNIIKEPREQEQAKDGTSIGGEL